MSRTMKASTAVAAPRGGSLADITHNHPETGQNHVDGILKK